MQADRFSELTRPDVAPLGLRAGALAYRGELLRSKRAMLSRMGAVRDPVAW